MKEATIEDLAYVIKQAKKKGEPQPIFFLGAGASVTGNIPLTTSIVEDILERYADSTFIKKLKVHERTYMNLMECLQPDERNELLKQYIDQGKINVTHIYLAQLLTNGYADYVLTVNFDNLMLRALALFNEFPATFDMAILQELTTTTFKEKSVVYLHGQHHGLWLLNTEYEMEKVKNTIPSIFDSIKNKRPWVFIGYSGSDPIFNYIKKLGRFDNGLFWVGYKEKKLNPHVEEFLARPNTNAYYIKGYDSDSFMIELNDYLGLEQPEILDKPFTSLKKMLDNIVDINDEEHFRGVKERLSMAKKDVETAIQQFEYREKVIIPEIELQKDKVKKLIINYMLTKQYDENLIAQLELEANKLKDKEVNYLLSMLFTAKGTHLQNLSKNIKGIQSDQLLEKGVEDFKKAISLFPNRHEAYFNWGITLAEKALKSEGAEAVAFFEMSNRKYQKVLDINPNYHQAYLNFGSNLSDIAELSTKELRVSNSLKAVDLFKKAIGIKSDDFHAHYNLGRELIYLYDNTNDGGASHYLNEAIDEFNVAIEIRPDSHETLNNMAACYGRMALNYEGEEADRLYDKAIELLEKAVKIKPDKDRAFYNWGKYLSSKAQSKDKQEAMKLYSLAFEKFKKSIELRPDRTVAFEEWGLSLFNYARLKNNEESKDLYWSAIDKLEKALSLSPDSQVAVFAIGSSLINIVEKSKLDERENLCELAIEKFELLLKLKPDSYVAYLNWGICLGLLAKSKSGIGAIKAYELSFSKYQKALDLKSDYKEGLYYYAHDLGNLALLKQGAESEILEKLAIENFQKSIKLGSDTYNFACFYAVRGMKNEAYHFLERSLENNEIASEDVKNDFDWKGFLQDVKFNGVIEKYST